MAYRVLEVTLISAEDLKKVTVFSKMRVYAVASISGGGPRMPTHRTHSDRQGGRSPMWHAPLRFPIPPGADTRGLALHVLLRTERAFGDRDVGEVFVPVQDLVNAALPGGEHRHLSYQVRRPMSGRKRGVLHISYSLTNAPAPADPPVPSPYTQYVAKNADAVTAYPPPYHQAMPPYGHAYAGAYAQPPHHQHHHHPYGYGASSATAPASTGGGVGAAGLGLGLLGAVGGMVLGDMLADLEMDASYDGGGGGGFWWSLIVMPIRIVTNVFLCQNAVLFDLKKFL